MKIDEVELRLVRLPYRAPFRTSFGEESEKHALILTVRSEGVQPLVSEFASGETSDQEARVDEIVLVDTDQICAAIKDIFDDTRSIAEPAGALASAPALMFPHSARAQQERRTAAQADPA